MMTGIEFMDMHIAAVLKSQRGGCDVGVLCLVAV